MVEEGRRSSCDSGMTFHVDSIFEEIGNFGRYQFVNYILIIIPVIFTGFLTGSYIFTTADQTFRCKIPECDGAMQKFEPSWLPNAVPRLEGVYDSCERYASNGNYTDIYGENSIHILFNDTCPTGIFKTNQTIKCDSWVYKEHTTIVSEFDVGCNKWKQALLGTMNQAGQFFGLPITGFISDRFGRQKALVVASFFSGCFGLVKSLAPDYTSFVLLEFLEPVVGSGVYGSAYIIGIEMVGAQYRVICTTILSSFFAIGEMLLGIVSWYFPYWRLLLRIIYTPPLLIITYLWLVPDSIRWLLSKGKTIAAAEILKKAAKVNGRVISDNTLKKFHAWAEAEVNSDPKKNPGGIIQVFKSRILVIRWLCCSFWWATCTFVYYGLSLNSVSIAGSPNMNFILVSLIEIPGYVIYYFCMNRFGRKATLSATWFGSGLACISSAFVPSDIGWLKLALYLFGKFNITIAFTAIYVYTAELFPTSNRHAMQNMCSMFGRLGSIVAPQTPILSVYFKEFPLVLFGASTFISGLTILAFPETSDLPLPDTIEEAENISRKKVVNKPNTTISTVNITTHNNKCPATNVKSNSTPRTVRRRSVLDSTIATISMNYINGEIISENTQL